jgi:hypothetical protein
MGVQALTAERTDEGDVGGLTGKGRQPPDVGENVDCPQTYRARYSCDFSRYFQSEELPFQGIALAVFPVTVLTASQV